MLSPVIPGVFIAVSASVQVAMSSLSLTSSAFKNNERIPVEYSYSEYGCVGHNLSPPLEWTPGPDGTKSYALTVFDPDARPAGWWHWVVFDIPADVHALAAGAGSGGNVALPKGTLQGRNDFQTVGYGGPCPPPGQDAHHYIFTIYALDVERLPGVSSLTSGPTLLKVIQGHILAKATLVGRFGR
jgi:Raf kinase inhibitor-like YbhB/YbcL family protein